MVGTRMYVYIYIIYIVSATFRGFTKYSDVVCTLAYTRARRESVHCKYSHVVCK